MVRQQGSAMGRSAGTAQENEVDRLKEEEPGGKYVDVSGRIRKIDLYYGLLVMEDGTKIRLEDILDLSGDVFNSCFDE